jgi:antirestriction protein ArdC
MSEKANWNELFEQALSDEGVMSKAYSVFHNYSLGNALLAASQLFARDLPLSPIASFNRWKELGRNVKKGEKALSLIMPVTAKVKAEEGSGEKDGSFTLFVLKRNWFTLAQTDGAEYTAPVFAPSWDKARALSALGIEQREFERLDGNMQGYASPRNGYFAINPLAALPHKTTFHELAHCLLHTEAEMLGDEEGYFSKDIKEGEAESVAYLCCATLNLSGLAESRAYIQHWLSFNDCAEEFKKRSAARIFSAANKILKAGEVSQVEGV